MIYNVKNVPKEIEYRFGKKPIDEYIKIHASRVPDKTAIIYYGTEITYKELDDYIDRTATLFAKLGVKKGDVVSIFMQNCPEFMFAFFGAQRLGAIAAPFNPMFKEFDIELDVNELKSKVIVTNSYLYPIVKNVRDKTTLEHILIVPLNEFMPEEPEIPYTFDFFEPDSFDDSIMFLEAIKNIEPNVPKVKRDLLDTAFILFTSGSTGLPKGALLTYEGTIAKNAALSQWYYHHEHETWLQSHLMCHIIGMYPMNVNIYNGSTVAIICQMTKEVVAAAIDKYKITTWYSSSLLVQNLIEWEDINKYNLCNLRFTSSTSYSVQTSKELADQWDKLTGGGQLVEFGYGLTESQTLDAMQPRERPKYGIGCQGFPAVPEFLIRIVDEKGKECGPEQSGEILLKNPGVMKGYLNSPEKTADTIIDGWLHTGDTGRRDEEGYLYWMGRRKEMIKTSGFSVFPEEVESYIDRHEAVAKSAIIGKPDERRGDNIKAFVVLNNEYKGKITEQEIIDWCKERMAKYKVPRELEFRDSIPYGNTGKLLRRVLLDEEIQKCR
ncbi:MAG: class I adenylate-forming enzyme family protein [Anaerovoracaceae bacterium]|jgi:long-chain acyl-CoA synthetase|nr:class I adenylate-forming enzyme family protein [Anaerovoracaceae bacterium]